MHVKPIRICLGHNGAKIIVENGECRTCRAEKRQITLTVITDRVDIVARAIEEEAVALPVVVLYPALSVGMSWIIKSAALVIGRQIMRRMRGA